MNIAVPGNILRRILLTQNPGKNPPGFFLAPKSKLDFGAPGKCGVGYSPRSESRNSGAES